MFNKESLELASVENVNFYLRVEKGKFAKMKHFLNLKKTEDHRPSIPPENIIINF